MDLKARNRKRISISVSALVCAVSLTLLSGTAMAAGSVAVNTRNLILYEGATGEIKVKADNTAGRVDWTSSGSASAYGSFWIENEIQTISVYGASTGPGIVTLSLSDAATFDATELTGDCVIYVAVLSNRSLSSGMSGDDVAAVQTRLYELGYYPGAADGVFGSVTEAAVRSYQSDQGLYADGIAGPFTQEALFRGVDMSSSSLQVSEATSSAAVSSLSLGMSGDAVYRLQAALAAAGYYGGDLDGEFGNITDAAVRAFQSAFDLYVDGIAGPVTLGVLGLSGVSAVYDSSSSAGSSASSGQTASSGQSVSDRVMAYGMSGDDISALQQLLMQLGYYTGSVDGQYGNQTESAVRSYQEDHGLETDGTAGPKTLAALGLQ